MHIYCAIKHAMKALLKNSTGVKIQNTPAPTISSPNDVIVHIAVSGLCRTDVYAAEGLIETKNPLILGHEFAGIIEQIGPNVKNLHIGERIAVMPILPLANDYNGKPDYSDSTMIGIDHDGSFSEYVSVPASSVYKLPDNVSFKQGAYMEPIAASLAVLNADIKPEQKGLIYGDNRISRLTERIMNAKDFHNVEVYDHSQSTTEPLETNSYDYIIETLATTETMAEMVRAVKPGGMIILKSRQHTPVAFDISELVKKEITLSSVNYGDFSEGIELVSSGKLQIDDLFGEVYPLEQFEEVFIKSKSGETKKLFFSAMDQNVWDR